MESSKNVLSISVENPMVIPLSLSSVMYTQYIPVFILLFFFVLMTIQNLMTV